MELIDKAAVVAEIERLYKEHSSKEYIDEGGVVLCQLEDFLDTLEVKEVDLEKELIEWHKEHSKQKEVLHKMQQMKPMLGRKHSEETLAKLRLRKNRVSPVAMMDKDGNILKTFDSIIQAERELGIHHTNISNCCLGKYKTSGGYKWKYLQKKKKQ